MKTIKGQQARDELKFISARLRGNDEARATLVEINWRFRETILDPCTASRIVFARRLAGERTHSRTHARFRASLYYASLHPPSAPLASLFHAVQIRKYDLAAVFCRLASGTVNIFLRCYTLFAGNRAIQAPGEFERINESIPIFVFVYLAPSLRQSSISLHSRFLFLEKVSRTP